MTACAISQSVIFVTNKCSILTMYEGLRGSLVRVSAGLQGQSFEGLKFSTVSRYVLRPKVLILDIQESYLGLELDLFHSLMIFFLRSV